MLTTNDNLIWKNMVKPIRIYQKLQHFVTKNGNKPVINGKKQLQ